MATYRERLKKAYRNRRTRTADLLVRLGIAKKRGTKVTRSRARKVWRRSRAKLQFWRVRLLKTESKAWQGCRGVTNTMILIVGGRAPVTSRKRWASFGNPDSDHHKSQRNADAVDFGIANAQELMDELARELGGPRDVDDFENFEISHNGMRFRIQLIAKTHGTGPHLHGGTRRIG